METKTAQTDLAVLLADKINAILVDYFNPQETIIPTYLYNRILNTIQTRLERAQSISPMQYTLRSGGRKIIVVISQDANTGLLEIRPVGYGDHDSADGEGCPILLDLFGGKFMLHVWGDINKGNPTHQIDLEGALETKRKVESQLSRL